MRSAVLLLLFLGDPEADPPEDMDDVDPVLTSSCVVLALVDDDEDVVVLWSSSAAECGGVAFSPELSTWLLCSEDVLGVEAGEDEGRFEARFDHEDDPRDVL